MSERASDGLTYVELIWLEKRIEHWILRAVAPGEAYSAVPHVRPGGEICSASPAGRKWSACCRPPIPSNWRASIPPPPVPVTGGMSTTDWRPARSRARICPRAMRPGSNDGGPNHHALRICCDDLLSRRQPFGLFGFPSRGDDADLERQRQRPHRALCRAAGRRAPRHRAGRRQAAGAARELPCRSRYLPKDVPLLKRVLALPRQTVCRTDRTIAVDGIAMGTALERDRRGRTLPVRRAAAPSPRAKSS